MASPDMVEKTVDGHRYILGRSRFHIDITHKGACIPVSTYHNSAYCFIIIAFSCEVNRICPRKEHLMKKPAFRIAFKFPVQACYCVLRAYRLMCYRIKHITLDPPSQCACIIKHGIFIVLPELREGIRRRGKRI